MATKKAKPEKAILMENSSRQEYQGYPAVETITGAEKIAIINGATPEVALLEQGFKWLGRWEVIARLRPYQELAADLIKEGQEAAAEELKIGDRRQPVYDPRLIFIKPTARGKKFWASYTKHQESWEPRIAFLAAVWETKPYIKPLPAGRRSK